MRRKNTIIISVIGLILLGGLFLFKFVQGDQLERDETAEIFTMDTFIENDFKRLDLTEKYNEQIDEDEAEIKTKEIMVLLMDEINSQTLLTQKNTQSSLFPTPVFPDESLEFGYSNDDRIPSAGDEVAVIKALNSLEDTVNVHLDALNTHFGGKEASIVIKSDERVYDEGRLFLGETVKVTLLDGKAVEIELDDQKKKLEVGEQAIFTRKEGEEISKIVFTNYGKWRTPKGMLHHYHITDEDYDTLIKTFYR